MKRNRERKRERVLRVLLTCFDNRKERERERILQLKERIRLLVLSKHRRKEKRGREKERENNKVISTIRVQKIRKERKEE